MTFPSTPEDNAIHEQNGRKWQWDGVKWVLIGNPVSDIDFRGQLPIKVEDYFEDMGDGTLLPVVESTFHISSLPSLDEK